MARHSDHCNTPLRTVANAAGEVTISIITSSIFSIFSALTFLAAALTFSVNLINITQENAQNNENTNNNMNMNMNMNTNSRRRRSMTTNPFYEEYKIHNNIKINFCPINTRDQCFLTSEMLSFIKQINFRNGTNIYID